MESRRRMTRSGRASNTTEIEALQKSPSRIPTRKKSVSPTRKSPSRNARKKSPSPVKESNKLTRATSPSRKSRQKSVSPIRKRTYQKRSKSPVKKSPSRLRKKSVSPTRKSPSRVKKESPIDEIESKNKMLTSITKEQILLDMKSNSPKVSLQKLNSFIKPSTPLMKLEDSGDIEVSKLTYNIDKLTPEPSQHSTITPSLTEKSNISQSHSVSRSISRSVYDESSGDDENIVDEIYKKNNDNLSSQQTNQSNSLEEFGGRLGSLFFFITVPILGLYLSYICSAKSCKFVTYDLLKLDDINYFFNKKLAIVYLSFIWIVTLLSVLRIGRVVKIYIDRNYVEYNFNGFATAFFTTIALFIGEYLKYDLIDLIYNNFFKLCVISICYGLFTTINGYIRTKLISEQVMWNPYGKTGKFLVDLYAGREIRPTYFKIFDMKLIYYKISIITAFILNGIFIYKNLHFPEILTEEKLTSIEIGLYMIENTTFSQIPLFTSTLIMIYILDLLIYEHHLTSSFEVQYEGVGGHLLMRYSIFPFMLTLISKYTLDHNNSTDEIPIWAMIVIAVIFIYGIYMKRSSNKLKYEYRLNPINPKLTYLDTIATLQSRRILVTSWWSLVRHPNHAGDILSLISLSSILYFNFNCPPLVAILYLIFVLIHRAIRIDRRCAKKYTTSWSRYTNRVQKLFIPKVF